MKKLIALLLTLSTLFAASCAAVKTGDDGTTETKKNPDEQTTAGEGTTAEEQTTAEDETTADDQTTGDDVTTENKSSAGDIDHIVQTIVLKLPLKDLLYASDNILRAQFISKDSDGNTASYCFKVLEEYYGKASKETVKVNITKYGDSIIDLPYEEGKEYYLALRNTSSQYTAGDEQFCFVSDMFMPVGDVSKITLYGEPIKENSDIEKLENDGDFVDYLKSVIASEDFPKPGEKRFIVSNNAAEIIACSDFVFAAKAVSEKFRGENERNKTKDFFVCEVIEVYKGNINVGDTVSIIFAKNMTEIGKTVIFAGYESSEGSKSFRQTSANSIFGMTEKDNIIALIEEQK
ncbi:MAG: hypothetical protein KBT31_03055 [Firmicutes bacterium]|nr:hypothetical protein [Candidatus Colimorpha enterica]